MRMFRLTSALCAIAMFGPLPGERELREEEGPGGGGGGGGGAGGGGAPAAGAPPAPPVPTVPAEPRRPVQLTEEQRLERAHALLDSTPAQRQVSKLDTSKPAEGQQATPPATPPAAPAQDPATPPASNASGERQAPASEFAAATERLLTRERELAEEQRRVAEERSTLARYATFEKMLREKDVLGALQSIGVSYDELSRAAVESRGIEGQASKIEKEIGALKKELETLRAEREETRRADLERRAQEEVGAEIAQRSPLLARYGERARREVYDRIVSHWQSTGAILPTAQAIAAVESEYRELVTKALGDESLRKTFLGAPAPTSGSSDRGAPVIQAPPPTTTITNEHAAELPPRASGVISEEEREARIARILEG